MLLCPGTFLLLSAFGAVLGASDDDINNGNCVSSTFDVAASAAARKNDQNRLEERLQNAKMELWARGAFALDENVWFGNSLEDQVRGMEWELMTRRVGPVRTARY